MRSFTDAWLIWLPIIQSDSYVTLEHELLNVSIFQHEPRGGVSAERMEAENARLGQETVDTSSGKDYA